MTASHRMTKGHNLNMLRLQNGENDSPIIWGGIVCQFMNMVVTIAVKK